MLPRPDGMSDEQLLKELALLVTGRADAPVAMHDIVLLLIALLRETHELKRRMNVYDAKGQGDMLTVRETMRITGLSRATVNRRMRDGSFVSIKADGRRYITRQSINRWLRCNRRHDTLVRWSTNPTPQTDLCTQT